MKKIFFLALLSIVSMPVYAYYVPPQPVNPLAKIFGNVLGGLLIIGVVGLISRIGKKK